MCVCVCVCVCVRVLCCVVLCGAVLRCACAEFVLTVLSVIGQSAFALIISIPFGRGTPPPPPPKKKKKERGK